MFTEMPSWVPLADIPQPVEGSDLFEQGPRFETSHSEHHNGRSALGEGKLTTPTAKQTHSFRFEPRQTILRPCRQVLQQKPEPKNLMETFKEGATSKAMARTPLAYAKQTIVARMTQLQSGPGLKMTESVVLRTLTQLPTLPKAPPRPADITSMRTPTSLPLANVGRVLSRPMAQTRSFDEVKKEARPREQQQQLGDPKPLSKRSIEHFAFPLQIKIDEQERREREGSRDTAKRIAKIKKKKVARSGGRPYSYSYQKPKKRPTLEPPRMGIFALYYILTKVGILSDAASHFEAKENIQKNQEELDKVHKLRIEEMQKAIKDEKSSQRWGMSNQIFSWMGSFMAIISGIAMIMSGVGVIAGAMLLTSGIFMLANHLLMITGGWDKICNKLPGEDQQKKKAVITWMQIGITVLCLILSGAAGVFGGFGAIGEAMQNFQAVFGGIMMLAGGISAIGQGVTTYQHRNRLAESLKHQRKLERIKHKQEDLFEKAHAGVERIRQLFKELSSALDFEAQLFQADQMVIGR